MSTATMSGSTTGYANSKKETVAYKAVVIDQQLTASRNDDPALSLFVKLGERLNDPWKPLAGSSPDRDFTDTEQEVKLSLGVRGGPPSEQSIKDLLYLGFDGSDIRVLSPAHPKHKSYKGREILIRRTVKDDGTGYWWNLFRVEKNRPDPMASEKVDQWEAVNGEAFLEILNRVRNNQKEDLPF